MQCISFHRRLFGKVQDPSESGRLKTCEFLEGPLGFWGAEAKMGGLGFRKRVAGVGLKMIVALWTRLSIDLTAFTASAGL